MARGPSGRVIVEVEPALKRALHARLVVDGRSLKDWFLECAESYLDPARRPLPLQVRDVPHSAYGAQESDTTAALPGTRSEGKDG